MNLMIRFGRSWLSVLDLRADDMMAVSKMNNLSTTCK
jgi:hypothetical protein